MAALLVVSESHHGASLDMISFSNGKVGSIYWGKFAQGPIHVLPMWDTTWTLLSCL